MLPFHTLNPFEKYVPNKSRMIYIKAERSLMHMNTTTTFIDKDMQSFLPEKYHADRTAQYIHFLLLNFPCQR